MPREVTLRRSPRHERTEPGPILKRRGKRTETSGGHRLFGHAAPGIEDNVAAPATGGVNGGQCFRTACGESGNSTASGSICSADRIERFFWIT